MCLAHLPEWWALEDSELQPHPGMMAPSHEIVIGCVFQESVYTWIRGCLYPKPFLSLHFNLHVHLERFFCWCLQMY